LIRLDKMEGSLLSYSLDEALRVARARGRLRSGSEAIDRLLGGGYEEGKITEVFGPSNSGKTQLAMQATVMAASIGWQSLYVDTEATFRPERVVQMAEARGLDASEVLDRIYSTRARDVAAQSEVLGKMAHDPRVRSAKLVVVDTVTKNFSLEFPDSERVGRRQGALGVYLNRIAIDAYLHARVVLLTNRVAKVTRDGVSQDVGVGGLTLGRFVSRSVRLARERGFMRGFVRATLESPAPLVPDERAVAMECHLSQRGFE
jgi:RecA/RadA recombinase